MKKILLFISAICAAIGCTTDTTMDAALALDSSEKLTVTFDDESRIQLNENLKTVWTKGDLVSVFYKSDANDCFQFDGETGDRSGTLSRVENGESTKDNDKIAILYPYNVKNKLLATGEILANMPATQNYLKDSFGAGSSLMVAESEIAQFTLKNVCGWLKLQFTGSAIVKKISIEGNNGEQLAGDICVLPSDASSRLIYYPSIELGDSEVSGSLIIDNNIIKTVTLDCGEGVELSPNVSTAFYIALPPQTLANGVKVAIETVNGTIIEKETSKSVTITRNSILPLSNVEISDSADMSFAVEFLNVTPQTAQYVCTPADNEMLYLLVSSQELGQYGVQGETPNELMQNYIQLLAENYMLPAQPDYYFVHQGANTEMPKETSRWSAEESVTVYAVGFNATKTVEFDGMVFATEAELATAVHSWEVPFLPMPVLNVQTKNTVSSAAGPLVLDITIENAVEGADLYVSTEAAWVTPTYADGKLTLAYEANTAAAVARKATITVAYGKKNVYGDGPDDWYVEPYCNPVDVVLTQEKDPNVVAVTLNIEVVGTQFNGIIVNVTPSDENATYALNQCAVEKDWETGAELEMDWLGIAENLLSYPGNATFHKGTLTNYLIKTNVINYEWNGYDYYVYAVPVEANSENDNWTVSQILGDAAVSEKVTIDISKMPKLTLVEGNGLTWNAEEERYELMTNGVEQEYVLSFNVENPVEGAAVTYNSSATGSVVDESWGADVFGNEDMLVIDNEAKTIKFTVNAYPADWDKSYPPYRSITVLYTLGDEFWGIRAHIRVVLCPPAK